MHHKKLSRILIPFLIFLTLVAGLTGCEQGKQDLKEKDPFIKGEIRVEVTTITFGTVKILRLTIKDIQGIEGADSFALLSERGELEALIPLGEVGHQYTQKKEVQLLIFNQMKDSLAETTVTVQDFTGSLALYPPRNQWPAIDIRPIRIQETTPQELLALAKLPPDHQKGEIPLLSIDSNEFGLLIMDDVAYDYEYAFDDKENFNQILGEKLAEYDFKLENLGLFLRLPGIYPMVDARTGKAIPNDQALNILRNIHHFYYDKNAFPSAFTQIEKEGIEKNRITVTRVTGIQKANSFAVNDLDELAKIGEALEIPVIEVEQILYILSVENVITLVDAINGTITVHFRFPLEEKPFLSDFEAKVLAFDSPTGMYLPVQPDNRDYSSRIPRVFPQEAEGEKLLLTSLDWEEGKGEEVILSFHPIAPQRETIDYLVKLRYLGGEYVPAQEHFTVLKDIPLLQYTLTIEIVGQGSVEPQDGKHEYEEGTEVDLVATPDTGWIFKEWTGDVDVRKDLGHYKMSLLMDKDKTVRAVFVTEDDQPVELADRNLEQAVRLAIDKPHGPIHLSDVGDLKELKARGRRIFSLEGIQELKSLRRLDLGSDAERQTLNYIQDIWPLQELTNLNWLNLDNNQITDLAALENLLKLEHLDLSENNITDITPLQDLTHLTYLSLEDNVLTTIEDLAGLSNLTDLSFGNNQVTEIYELIFLTNLERLQFFSNQVEEILPLQYLTNLDYLDFHKNQVKDIEPLVINGGFGEGDFIDMRHNQLDLTPDSLNRQHIFSLQEKGVEVHYLPQQGYYLLTVERDGEGTVEPEVGIHPFEEDDMVELKAIPAEGWVFEKWEGDVTAPENSQTTVHMTRDKTVKALFIEEVDAIIEFEDPHLEQVIREIIGQEEGPIFQSDVMEITELQAQGREIESLKGIEYLQSLERLFLQSYWEGETRSYNHITHITPLQGLTNLTTLNVSENNIEDITPLQGLTNLTILHLSENNIGDITPLQGLTELRELYLGWNIVKSWTSHPLANGGKITDISPLENLTKLEDLSFTGHQVSDLRPLQSLTVLRNLYFFDNHVTNLSPLEDLTGLQRLYFGKNQVEDLKPLSQLTSLTHLVFSENQVRDLSPLQNLMALTELDFWGNKVHDIQALQNLTSLTTLDFHRNQVEDISPLAHLNALKKLWFYANQVVDISPLQNLTRLEELLIANNQVEDLSPLVDNDGIGSGDVVDIRWNHLDLHQDSKNMQDIRALKERGVEVEYLQQQGFYLLTVEKVGEGTVEPEEGIHPCEEDSLVELEAIPAAGWSFQKWEGAVNEPEEPQTTVHMTGDKTVKALFIKEVDTANVIYYADYYVGNNYMLDALNALGYSVENNNLTLPNSWADFNEQLKTDDFYLAVMFNQNTDLGADRDKVNTFIMNGGRVIFTDWTRTADFASLFEASYTGNNNQSPVTITETNLAQGIDNPMHIENPGWGRWSMGLRAVESGESLAHFTTSSDNSDDAIVLGNGGQTAIIGFLGDTPPTADGQRFYENLFHLITAGIIPPS